MSSNDYYEILEVSKNSSLQEIEKSYKQLVQKWHPDKKANKNNPEASEKYKEITEAYDVLSDENKRAIYDLHGHEGLQSEIEGEYGMNISEVFQAIGQQGLGAMLGGMFGQMMHGSVQMQEDDNCGVPNVNVRVMLNLNQAYNGTTIKQKIDRIDFCNKCNGTGTKDKNTDLTCKACNGQSPISSRFGMMCPVCRNTGLDPKVEKCKKCNGAKGIETQVDIEIPIPKGVFHGCKIILLGQGHEIPKDRKKGNKSRTDLIVVIMGAHEDSEGIFKRGPEITEGNVDPFNLLITLDVSFVESISGFYREVEHVDGHKIKFALLEPCRHGDSFVIKGEGVPKLARTMFAIGNDGKIIKEDVDDKVHKKFGDLVVQINVEHPKSSNMSSEVRTKIIKLLDGKQPKIQSKNILAQLITFEQYKKNEQIREDTEKMKKEYNKKQKRINNEDDSDESESSEESESDNDMLW